MNTDEYIIVWLLTLRLDDFRLLFLRKGEIGISSSPLEVVACLRASMWTHGTSTVDKSTATNRKAFFVREKSFSTDGPDGQAYLQKVHQ